MAKGIFNIVADKIFPPPAPGSGNQTENNSLRPLLFSQPITKGDAGAALNHITGQFVARQNPTGQTAAVNSDATDNQKTVADFLREIQNSQPFDEAALSKKKEHVELKLSKPPGQLSVADYDAATWRAVFNKAGYSLLTDAEVGMAVQAMKDTGYKSTNDGFSLSNLRRFDAKPGPMFVGTDGATIEKAKQAGQAVLQYQEYKAKGIDAAIEKGQNYATEALGGFIEKPYNAAVNNINGLSEPFRAGERKLFGSGYLPELPRSTVGDRSEYWQQKRYGGVTLNMMGEGAATIQVGVMTGRPLYNSRVGALLGLQVGAYNLGVGATGSDPLHPGREMSGLERGSRIIGGTMGVASAPFSPGGRLFANDALAFPNTARRAINNLDDIFKPPTAPLAEGISFDGQSGGTRITPQRTPLEKMGDPMEVSISTDTANKPHIAKGNRPPYSGLRAQEIVLKQETVFVRVHNENMPGSWLMRKKDVDGLTALQIKEKFALPDLPTKISEVHVPAGTRVRVGIASSQKGWGIGGGMQYELIDKIPLSSFKNTRKLK